MNTANPSTSTYNVSWHSNSARSRSTKLRRIVTTLAIAGTLWAGSHSYNKAQAAKEEIRTANYRVFAAKKYDTKSLSFDIWTWYACSEARKNKKFKETDVCPDSVLYTYATDPSAQPYATVTMNEAENPQDTSTFLILYRPPTAEEEKRLLREINSRDEMPPHSLPEERPAIDKQLLDNPSGLQRNAHYATKIEARLPLGCSNVKEDSEVYTKWKLPTCSAQQISEGHEFNKKAFASMKSVKYRSVLK
jgi:hypothetical protein